MESHIVRILDIKNVTHDVRGFKVEKPSGYDFTPGQATEVAINKSEWKDERRPFTFTNLPGDDHLEFTIKTYPERKGVTNQLLQLNPGNELILHDVWGAISYKGSGLFIAGGAGITPFLSIFRSLKVEDKTAGNRLLFANKSKRDIILEDELKNLLDGNIINILSEENLDGYKHGHVTEAVLKELSIKPDDKLYICGPPPMLDALLAMFKNMGLSDQSVIMEI